MKEPSPEQLKKTYEFLNELYEINDTAQEVLYNLAALCTIACTNTNDPRVALSAFIEILQNVEENPLYDELYKMFKQQA